MKQISILIIAVLCITSCSTLKNVSKDPLQGKWSLHSYSAYMAIDENTTLPEYKMGDVVWTFDSRNSNLNIQKKNTSEKNDFSLKEGSYSYTREADKIRIAGQEYLISFNPDYSELVSFDAQGKETEKIKREVLVLDTNTDPRLAKDAPVLYFYKM